MDERAKYLVEQYVDDHLEIMDAPPKYILKIEEKTDAGNSKKYRVSTSLSNEIAYIVSYDGDEEMWTLDAYRLFDSMSIHDCCIP